MINIVFNNMFTSAAYRKGYYYRRVYPSSNPLAKASDIEYMSEDEQLRLFCRIDRENENLYVFGGDYHSLLREIFIKPHLDKDGYVNVRTNTLPLKAEYKGFTFEYMLSLDIKNKEDLKRFIAIEKVNKRLDDTFFLEL